MENINKDTVKGFGNELKGKVQKAYGYSKEELEDQFGRFTKDLKSEDRKSH